MIPQGLHRPSMFGIENIEATMLDCVSSIQVHRCRPRLSGKAHRPARQSMEPFIELPFPSFAKANHGGQVIQLAAGFFQPAGLYEGRYIDSADKRPCPAVMIVMRLVEIPDAVIFSPVLLARLYRRIEGAHGKRLVQPAAT